MGLLKSLRKRLNQHKIDYALKHYPSILKERSGKGLFLDCGSNLGQGYTFFSQYFEPSLYDAYLIEPNPNCMAVLKEKFKAMNNINFIEAAAWINEDDLSFFGLVENERGATSDGGSVIKDHNSKMYESDTENSITVKAISLSNLIKEKAKAYDQIIIKMDIESAEYPVLEDLIKTEATKYVDFMFIEFHHQYFEHQQEHYQTLGKLLVKQLKKQGTKVALWH
ncbi:MAG: FkbM family methyltransferase [Kangiellaceae bacterium]|jgi:FkbM family methyltransferase|nr:FkbM family methyltransferase [Kangiellaceae bacterium]